MVNDNYELNNIDTLTFFEEVTLYEYCSIYEAMLWIAFRIPPITYYSEDSGERDDLGYNEEIGLCSRIDIDNFINKDIAEKYEITVNPELDDFDYTDDNFGKYEINEKKFRYSLDSFLQVAKSKLYTNLRDGNIKAKGLLFATIKKDLNVFDIDLSDENNWDEIENWCKSEYAEIPYNFWILDNIDWDNSYANSLEKWYIYILIQTKDLIKLFPPDISKCRTEIIYSHNGFLFTDKDINKLKSITYKGRPSKNWDDIYLKTQEILYTKEFRGNQNTLILELQEWYETTYKERIGESTLKEKIKPFFDLYKKSKNSI